MPARWRIALQRDERHGGGGSTQHIGPAPFHEQVLVQLLRVFTRRINQQILDRQVRLFGKIRRFKILQEARAIASQIEGSGQRHQPRAHFLGRRRRVSQRSPSLLIGQRQRDRKQPDQKFQQRRIEIRPGRCQCNNRIVTITVIRQSKRRQPFDNTRPPPERYPPLHTQVIVHDISPLRICITE